jgi:general secretion pathway protein G
MERKTRRRIHHAKGMTLGELLVVIVIVALLAIATMINIKRQIDRGYDARRKTDLTRIRTALEDYYNDHSAFPTTDTWKAMNCKTGASMDFLKPYLDNKPIPCDPQSNTPYLYDANNGCTGYVVLTALRDTGDKEITSLGCNPYTGCGYGNDYNWGVGTGSCTVPALGFDPGAPAVPTPLPGVTPGEYGCASDGSSAPESLGCQTIGRRFLEEAGCPSFSTPNCDGMCPTHQNYWYLHCR